MNHTHVSSYRPYHSMSLLLLKAAFDALLGDDSNGSGSMLYLTVLPNVHTRTRPSSRQQCYLYRISLLR